MSFSGKNSLYFSEKIVCRLYFCSKLNVIISSQLCSSNLVSCFCQQAFTSNGPAALKLFQNEEKIAERINLKLKDFLQINQTYKGAVKTSVLVPVGEVIIILQRQASVLGLCDMTKSQNSFCSAAIPLKIEF